MRAFVEVPLVEFDVDKLIRNRLKEHIRGKMNTSFLHAQSCRYFELRRSESPYCFGKRLFLQIRNIFGRERITLSCKRTECADFLCSYDEILFHKAVSLGEYRNDIFIKLYAEQYNHHAE